MRRCVARRPLPKRKRTKQSRRLIACVANDYGYGGFGETSGEDERMSENG
jgi:hypothetical protein